MNKLYSLPLAVLLFSACSTKEAPVKKAIPSPTINKTAAQIVAIQPKQTEVKRIATNITRTSPPAEIIKTPILTQPAPQMRQRADFVPQTIVPMPILEETQREVIPQQKYIPEPIQSFTEVEPQIFSQAPQYETQSSFQGELGGDFRGNDTLVSFIDRMVNEHGFDKSYLNQVFSQAQNSNYNAGLSNPSSPNRVGGAWDRYRQAFIYERNIQRGIKFWNKHKATLNRATAKYGVPAEYIVGIIGIETAYGVNFGKKKVLDVLTTKSMLPNRRNRFYTKQLEKFLIMTRQSKLDPTELMGSNAGAMGYGQFIASSYLDFAVDFNGDGKTDLWNAQDAIGSIANYFARNGWNSSIDQVAIRAKYKGNRFKRLKTGYKTKYSQYKLRKKYKIKPRTKMSYRGPVSLLRLNRSTHDELWFGTHNFRVITTYNHSSHYGMAVFQLAKEVKNRIGGYYSSL